MPTIDPYVPATVRNDPATITKMLQPTINIHFGDFVALPSLQLSYSHMKPIGWKDRRVPNRAPTSDTRPPKTGIALAMMYAIKITPKVQLSHVAQCVIVFAVRCREFRRSRTNTNLAGD